MSQTTRWLEDPHNGQPVVMDGERLENARAALVLLHGRGASAEDILALGKEVSAVGLALAAPQAAGGSWYPNRFIAPTVSNEPWLSSALHLIGTMLSTLQAAGLPAEKVILAGFSQGACLALEYAARNGRRYGGVAGFSGGIIGAEGEERIDQGNLSGTPVFLGCSDIDPHIPMDRVELSARLLQAQGARVTTRIYPGMGHTVNQDELDWLRARISELLSA